MEQRRLLNFFIASMAFWFLYISLQAMFRPPVAAPNAALDNPAAEELVVGGEENGKLAEADPSLEAEEKEQSESDSADPPRNDQPQWLTLGSMDPQLGYQMLVTLNTRGGGVERIELTERDYKNRLKYKRVDVRHGYLGYLAALPSDTIDGLRVNVVGPGTPAAMAGMKVGDTITQVDGNPVLARQDLETSLLETVPGDTIAIELLRSGSPQTINATLSEHPLDLVRLAEDGGADKVEGNLSRLSCLMTLGQVNRKSVPPGARSIPGLADPADLVWKATPQLNDEIQSIELQLEMSAAEMKAVGGKPVRLVRSYSLGKADYSLDMSVQIDNLAEEPQDLAFRLEGANGLTLEGWWYSNKISPNFSGAAARDLVYKTAADGHELVSGYELLKLADKDPKNPGFTVFAPDGEPDAKNLKYIGIDAQYFLMAYVPPADKASFTTFRRAGGTIAADAKEIPDNQERAVNSAFFVESVAASVPAGGAIRQEFQMFVGPKDPEILAPYELGDNIYYGWFSKFAKLLGGLLHILAGLVGNYALAIILLTVIVRGCMFPLSRKAAVNAQKMQELAPEMKKIKEKHKDDLEGQMKAQRELQKRVGFNPMAGCLPMFLQLPIFIGLYRALSVDIELRQQPVFSGWDWASNLAGPDMFAYWGDWMPEYFAGRGTGWLGPYFNILPVIVVALFLAQQKLFMPPATDEQTAMTQKMMNVMTLMMGLFFFRVPAGLCIYFITSSLWGIGERLLVKKTLPTKTHFDSTVLEGAEDTKSEKSMSLADRIRSQVATPEPTFERPNKRKRPKKN